MIRDAEADGECDNLMIFIEFLEFLGRIAFIADFSYNGATYSGMYRSGASPRKANITANDGTAEIPATKSNGSHDWLFAYPSDRWMPTKMYLEHLSFLL